MRLYLESCACRQHVNRVLTNTGQIKSDLARCLLAEFLGTLLFQIFGGAAPPKDTTAPAANGFALVCISKCLQGMAGMMHWTFTAAVVLLQSSAAICCRRSSLQSCRNGINLLWVAHSQLFSNFE